MVFATVAAVVVVAVASWAVVRYWVPGGSLAPSFRLAAYRSGLSRRAAFAATALLALGAGGSLLVQGIEGVGLGWALAAGLYGGGLVLVAIAASNRPRYRALKRADATPAGEVTGGPVAVSGTVEPAAETLTTPFSETDAVCCQWSIAQYAENHRGSGGWYTTDYGRERTRFYVADDSGRVLVDPADAWLGIAAVNGPTSPTDRRAAFSGGGADRSLRVEEGEALPDRVAAFCREETRTDLGTGLVDRETKLSEQTVEPGERVLVVGEADSGQSPDGYATTVVSGTDPRRSFVASGPAEAVRAELEKSVRRGLGVGAALTVVGAAALAWLTVPI